MRRTSERRAELKNSAFKLVIRESFFKGNIFRVEITKAFELARDALLYNACSPFLNRYIEFNVFKPDFNGTYVKEVFLNYQFKGTLISNSY